MCVISTSDIFSVLHTRCDAMKFSVDDLIVHKFSPGHTDIYKVLKVGDDYCVLEHFGATVMQNFRHAEADEVDQNKRLYIK